MPVDLSGNWQLVNSEGFEEYLRSIKTPEDKIKEVAGIKSALEIKQTGDNEFTVTSGLIRDVQSYSIGTPFKSIVNGTEVTSTANWEGTKLVMKTTSADAKFAGKEHTITREIVGGKLIQKLFTAGGPVATRTFQK